MHVIKQHRVLHPDTADRLLAMLGPSLSILLPPSFFHDVINAPPCIAAPSSPW